MMSVFSELKSTAAFSLRTLKWHTVLPLVATVIVVILRYRRIDHLYYPRQPCVCVIWLSWWPDVATDCGILNLILCVVNLFSYDWVTQITCCVVHVIMKSCHFSCFQMLKGRPLFSAHDRYDSSVRSREVKLFTVIFRHFYTFQMHHCMFNVFILYV